MVGKRIAKSTKNLLSKSPAAAKVISMTGGSLFTADRLVGWFNRVIGVDEITPLPPSGIRTPLGIATGVVFAVGVFGTNLVTRYFIMVRRDRYNKPTTIPQPAIVVDNEPANHHNNIVLRNIHVPAQTSRQNVSIWVLEDSENIGLLTRRGYQVMIGLSCYYMFNSGTSGLLSSSSIFRAFGFQAACTAPDKSGNYIIVIITGTGVYLFYSTVLSFSKYNLLQIRVYYRNLIVNQGYKKISWYTYLQTLINVTPNTLNIVFTGHRTWEIINDEMLCHLGIPPIPDNGVKALVFLSAIGYFFIMGFMTLASVQNLNSSAHKNSLSELLAENPFYRRVNALIHLLLSVDTFVTCSSIFLSALYFPSDFDEQLTDLAYLWKVYVPVMIFAACMLITTFSLDMESYLFELTQNRDENIYKQKLKKHEEYQARHRQRDGMEIELIDDSYDQENYLEVVLPEPVAIPVTPVTNGMNGLDHRLIEISPRMNPRLSESPHSLFNAGINSTRNARAISQATPINKPSQVDESTGVHFVLE